MRLCFTMLFLCLLQTIHGQIEICDNAIDDDNDGLVDINDPDCICLDSVPSGLIPNPSFEGRTCCPDREAELDCASSWIQASAATSDYFHTCGNFTYPSWLGNSYQTPIPIPDGNGWVGFRNGKPGNPQFKEYIGSCLNATMEIGKTYKIDFFLGFPAETAFEGINMTFYAHEDCNAIPFGNNNDAIGCPLNTPGWTQLDQIYVEGRDEWKNVVAEFVADREYNVFVLGPGCDQHPDFNQDPYFFVDRLALAETNEFDVPFAQIEGNICEENLTIIASTDASYNYQWYKDGIAIIGATSPDIIIPVVPESEGIYQCVFGVGSSCFFSEEYDLQVPIKETDLVEVICEGDVFSVGDIMITETAILQFFHVSEQGCDSVVNLDLTVLETPLTELTPVICEDESFAVAGQVLTEAGFYEFSLPSSSGCDSTVAVTLEILLKSTTSLEATTCANAPYLIDGDVLTVSGTYPYSYTNVAGCDSTLLLTLEVLPTYDEAVPTTICEGDTLVAGDLEITAAGDYLIDLTTTMGCDSIVTMLVDIAFPTSATIAQTICVGDTFSIANMDYATEGIYEVSTTNTADCDSFITLELTVIDLSTDLLYLPLYTVSLGDEVQIEPTVVSPAFSNFQWQSSQSGTTLASESSTLTYTPIDNDRLTVTASDENGCMAEAAIDIRISRDIAIHVPNIFSPNGDGQNDVWKITVSKSIASLDLINVYDRWGNLVYTEENVPNANEMQGWDGTFSGQNAAAGVYVYHAQYTALDGKQEESVGDVTVIR